MSYNERKRRSLTLAEKVEIIRLLENGKKQSDLVRQGYKSSTINDLWKNREELQRLFVNSNSNFKKIRKCEFPTVDQALLDWFNIQRQRNISISGPVLLEKARKIAEIQNIEGFKCSDGWLGNWKRRHNIVFKTVSGEESAVNLEGTEDWLTHVWPRLCDGYLPKDIFNADKTGLFYRLMPSKTLEYKGQSCHGGKQAKDRLTVLFCSNSTGTEKFKPVVVGKSAKPRCFKNLRDLKSLPVEYFSNKNSWMTKEIFSSWLHQLNQNMKSKNRKILLLIDNCPPHVAANFRDLSNVNVVFFPPNATSILQPLDRGIINSFKVHYRTHLVKRIITLLDEGERVTFNIDVLQAIYGIATAWNFVSPTCIINCFKNSGIANLSMQSLEEISSGNLDHTNLAEKLQVEQFSIEEFVRVDNHLTVCEEPTLEAIARSFIFENVPNSPELDVEIENDNAPKLLTSSQALNSIQDLRYYLTVNGNESEQKQLDQVEDFVLNLRVKL